MEVEEMSILAKKTQQENEMPNGSERINLLGTQTQYECCAFSRQEINGLEWEERSKSARKLTGVIMLYVVVMVVEIVGGLKANSLAVMSDAGHLLSDVAGFSISLFSVWASGWGATHRQSFGYHRLEILGALLSVQLIWLISGILIYEAVSRILDKSERVNGVLMFAIAALGFVVNLVVVIWLGGHGHDHGHDHEEEVERVCSKPKVLNINIQGAYLHVMVDMIQSAGVMISGAIIWAKPHWLLLDLLCTLIFSLLSLTTTVSMLKSVYGILMEQVPTHIDIATLKKDLNLINGVQQVHDLHVWALTVGKDVLSCHVSADPDVNSTLLIRNIRDYCQNTHKIHHITVQVDY